MVSFFYQHGIGCKVNKDKALELYLFAIKQDKVLKQDKIQIISISNMIKDDEMMELQDDQNNKEETNKSNDGALDFNCKDEVKINPDERTFVQYAISAREGNIMAQYNLGCCYQYGKGVNKDEKKAFEWYLKSAENDNSDGQNNLGYCYKYAIGTNKDVKKAFEWYLKSAEAGNNDAQLNLGHCYEYGIGTNKEEKRAFEWYLKSAKAGNKFAQYNMGICYQYEIGIEKNIQEATRWYKKALENGYDDAKTQLNVLSASFE